MLAFAFEAGSGGGRLLPWLKTMFTPFIDFASLSAFTMAAIILILAIFAKKEVPLYAEVNFWWGVFFVFTASSFSQFFTKFLQ